MKTKKNSKSIPGSTELGLATHPASQKGKRVPTDELKAAVDECPRSAASLKIIWREHHFASQKLGWIEAQPNRPDRSERSGSATYTLSLTTDPILVYAERGRRVTGGSHKGGNKKNGGLEVTRARHLALAQWYRRERHDLQKTRPGRITDAAILRRQPTSGIRLPDGTSCVLTSRTLSRIKKLGLLLGF